MEKISEHAMSAGYLAIIEMLGLKAIPHYRWSYILPKGARKIIVENHYERHYYPSNYAPKDQTDLLQQLEFALKYDGLNLEILKQSFPQIPSQQIERYITAKPTSKHARKIGFLYEMLLAKHLDLPDLKQGTYVDLLDPEHYYVGAKRPNRRYRINDNLLGNSDFCPLIRKTDTLIKFETKQLDQVAKKLVGQYDPMVIARAIQYLYSKETMSSYEIERERPNKKRLARFIELLKEVVKTATIDKQTLIKLQNSIVDPRFKDYDYRNTQNYIGEQLDYYHQKLHYISPKAPDVPTLMTGLLSCLERMIDSQIHPVIAATAIAFGFVFIHPFEDGNGRLHRFLIHYILSRLNFTPQNAIFPVSATLLKNIKAYDGVLEFFSIPLLSIIKNYDLTSEGELSVNEETLPHYQYIDYTKLAEYLFQAIETTINTDFKDELNYIASYDKTKTMIQNIIDLPDKELGRIINFIAQNNGKLSKNKRQRYFAMLTEKEIAEIESVVQEVML